MKKLSQQQIKLDERNHVEKPLIDQLAALGWEVLDLQAQQTPGETHRSSLTEVLMLPVLRAQLKTIQPWLQDDQADHFASIACQRQIRKESAHRSNGQAHGSVDRPPRHGANAPQQGLGLEPRTGTRRAGGTRLQRNVCKVLKSEKNPTACTNAFCAQVVRLPA